MHLLFDLDGTLTDSFPGISQSINQTLTTLGREAVPLDQLRPFVGARLATIFGSLLQSEDEALIDRAVEIYRPLFDEVGILESRVFPGIPDALTTFRDAGHSLQVVTVRSIGSAKLVVRHFGLDHYFDAVHGPVPTERTGDKAALVRAALDRAGAGSEDAIMIGDRAEDIRAARAHGIGAVAVAWGYGAPAELQDAGPDYLAQTVDDLVAYATRMASR
ncbi:MAG TPA: HAD hydrolase-like protein [Vicinamibacterales bacterium]|nr:HAD hydrolase-like protein [Vicinamibacterales bacterium]